MGALNTFVNIGAVASIASLIGATAQEFIDANAPAMIEGSGYVDAPVVAGETAVVHWTIVKLTNCPGVVWRRWEGEDGFLLRGARIAAKIPQNEWPQFPNIVYTIPKEAPVGELELFVDVEYDCGTGKIYDYTLGPVTMEVIEGD